MRRCVGTAEVDSTTSRRTGRESEFTSSQRGSRLDVTRFDSCALSCCTSGFVSKSDVDSQHNLFRTRIGSNGSTNSVTQLSPTRDVLENSPPLHHVTTVSGQSMSPTVVVEPMQLSPDDWTFVEGGECISMMTPIDNLTNLSLTTCKS